MFPGYTAHAVGCHVANTSLRMMLEMDEDGAWQTYKDDWSEKPPTALPKLPEIRNQYTADVWSVWSKRFVQNISNSRKVESVIALGSVLAISLHDIQAGRSSILSFSKAHLATEADLVIDLSAYVFQLGSYCGVTDSPWHRLQLISRGWPSKDVTRRVDRLQGPLPGSWECVLPDG
jgi:hypothetical protein